MKTETKHTPGPWKVMHSSKIGHLDVWSLGADEPQSRKVVVSVEPSDTTQPDARLIAAAPAMLEALKACIELGDMGPDGDAGKIARNAIAKATTQP